MDVNEFLNPKSRYRGNYSPQAMVFDHNLQEFSTQVSYIVSLETNGKIAPAEAYRKIKALWKQVKASKKALLTPEDP